MLKHDTDGSGGDSSQRSYCGYNPHTDVETLTAKTVETQVTYGYTAYGHNDADAFTGIDKPDSTQPEGQQEAHKPTGSTPNASTRTAPKRLICGLIRNRVNV